MWVALFAWEQQLGCGRGVDSGRDQGSFEPQHFLTSPILCTCIWLACAVYRVCYCALLQARLAIP